MFRFGRQYCVYPCPCGYFGDPVKACTCSSSIVTKYQKRISGPLLDRFDIHIEVPRVEYEKLSSQRLGEASSNIQKRVEQTRLVQRTRFSLGEAPEAPLPITCNADMRPEEVRQFCQLDETSRNLMRAAMSQLQVSAQTYHRVQREIVR